MSKEPSRPEPTPDDAVDHELRKSLIESLLQTALQSGPQVNESRINAVLDQISSDDEAVVSQPAFSTTVQNRRRWKRWAAVAAAIFLLTAMSYALITESSSAQAMSVVERSIAAAKESIARKYRLLIDRRTDNGATKTVESDLYVEGSDKITIRYPHPLFPKRHFWLGENEGEAWLVPPLGPIRLGNQSDVGIWLGQQEGISTPYLHFETILKKMRKGYRLKENPEKVITLTNGETRNCNHIKGTFRGMENEDSSERNRPPTTIEFLADADTGMTMRLEARWDKPDKTNRTKVIIEYLEAPTLPHDWFSHDGHASDLRRRLRFDE